VIPARDEADRIAATVEAVRRLPSVGPVIVVNDGSTDATSAVARAAGAVVVEHRWSRGKAAAMVTGAEMVRVLDEHDGRRTPRHLLFLDADLGPTAASVAPLMEPVVDGRADLTIARFPGRERRGKGLVMRVATRAIRRRTGWLATEPLSGQRCVTRTAFDRLRPLAHGFGVETAMTLDALRLGLRVAEVDVPLAHRERGHDLRSELHKARQLRDVLRALAVRSVRRVAI
jgi:glycosyltransferase involved in cell wall biosynthesis